MDTDNDSRSEDMECILLEVVEAGKIITLNIFPTKSRARYDHTYEIFIECRKKRNWVNIKKITGIN